MPFRFPVNGFDKDVVINSDLCYTHYVFLTDTTKATELFFSETVMWLLGLTSTTIKICYNICAV